jgi:hypothetical protein
MKHWRQIESTVPSELSGGRSGEKDLETRSYQRYEELMEL